MFDIEKALAKNAWPFVEAKAILDHIGGKLPKKGYVLFETGYGPSGLPHIGTFGEVVRTTMIRKAFEKISGMPTRLFCVSDDMDGMRKIPDIIPNHHLYVEHLGKALTSVPDPFQTHESYGHNMNARLRAFLDGFGFEYEFISATETYKNGVFNEMLLRALERYEDIMDIMLPTLGDERRQTYSPFMPVDQKTNKVLQVPILEVNKKQGTIVYKNEDGDLVETEVTNGKCKLQWKPDLGMRWAAFDVDFEMYGKDHLVNGVLYSKISKVLCDKAPHQTFYELFLDEKGEKISKTKGNGLTIDQWLRYATKDSLAYFMYLSPKKAKKLYFDVVPKCVDEYLSFLKAFHTQTEEEKMANPLYHIYNGDVPEIDLPVSYGLILNLVSACGAHDVQTLLKYVSNLGCAINEKSMELLMELLQKAVNYYDDFIVPLKKYHLPDDAQKELLLSLAAKIDVLEDSATAEEIQNLTYQVGKDSGVELREWFSLLYQVLLGQQQGPRFGSFAKLYGMKQTVKLIREKCVN